MSHMQIRIAERLRPFSHTAGTCCILPGSTLRLQVFPSLIRIHDMTAEPKLVKEFPIDVEGPVIDFTVQQDLEKGHILIWGQGQGGYFKHKEVLPGFTFPQNLSRLSLGNHKAQDWDLMTRRLSFEEIFPIWHRLGQMTPILQSPTSFQGTLALLEECRQKIEGRKILEILPAFKKVFLAGFEGMLSPRLEDSQHQGFSLSEVTDPSLSPLWLLTQGAELIQSLFLKREDQAFLVLPALPPDFHCGRLLGVQVEGLGKVDIEWTKKEIRRMGILVEIEGEYALRFSKDIAQFRLRQNAKEKGSIHKASSPLSLKAGYAFLDNFQK